MKTFCRISSAAAWSRTRERMNERTWFASSSQMLSTVRFMLRRLDTSPLSLCPLEAERGSDARLLSWAAGWRAACAHGFHRFDGCRYNVVGRIAARRPRADQVAAGVFGADA